MNTSKTLSEHNASNGAEDFIDKAEVAKRLKKTPRTIEVWAKRGIIPHIKIGRSVLYSWPAVVSHLQSNYAVRPR